MNYDFWCLRFFFALIMSPNSFLLTVATLVLSFLFMRDERYA